jgi:hypothetical protein
MKVLQRTILFLLALFFVFSLTAVPNSVKALATTAGLAFDDSRDLAFSALAGGVIIIDVSDPTNPILVTDSIQTQGIVQDLHYDSATQRLYIAADEGDLEIWDIQNPTAPQQISVTPIYYFGVETPATSVDVVGNTAYVSTSWGYLHWLDVSDPANPVDFGFNGQGGNPSREVHVGDDGLVYLASPDTIRYAINANGSLSSAGSNTYANSYQIFADGGYVYISTGTGPFQILDASQGSLPIVSTYTTNNVNDIYVAGNYAYIANGPAGLRVLDVTNRSAPYEIGFDDSDGATDVVVSNSYAYVRSGQTFRVVDVSVPSSPSVTGTFDASGGGGGGVGNIAPIANAGPSQAVQSRARVFLDGSNSYDLDGTIESYSWTQISGLTVNLRKANTAEPRFRAPKVTSYPVVVLVFELTVTDNEGATGTNQVMVTVLP